MAVKSSPIPNTVWRDPLCVVALGFGAGALPKAPGTWGTLIALPFYFLLARLPLLEYVLLMIALFIAGIWICARAGEVLGIHDHGAIVWDEMVGFWVTMISAPPAWPWIVVGFVLFRAFDILKPWPINWLDRQVSGGLGVMVDDLIAGIYAAICLYFGGVLFSA
jgi:phosphatidylglycerophosphatase A